MKSAPRTIRDSNQEPPCYIPVRIISHGALGNELGNGVCTDIRDGSVAFESEAELDLTGVVELVFPRNSHFAECRRFVRLLYRARRQYGGYFRSAA